MFVVLKGPRRGLPLSAEGLDEILDGARRRAGLEHATCHELRHTCLTRLREAGMALEAVQAQAGHRSIESTRVYLHLTNDWLAGEYRRAAALIDADTAAVAEMLAAQEAGRPVSALPARAPAASRAVAGSTAAAEWAQIEAAAPRWLRSMRRYLRQLGTFLAPRQRRCGRERAAPVRPLDDHRRRAGQRSATSAATTSRTTRCGWPPSPGAGGPTITTETHRQRMRTVRAVLRADHRVGLARRPAP